MSDDRISILICKDAGAASLTMLAREDLRIRWALTPAEALAVIRLTRCAVCITRASLAKPVVAACTEIGRDVSSIVLLDQAQWTSWRAYFDAGATAVLQATEAEQLLDAMSDATGVSFRTAPRIPFKTEVRLAQDPRNTYTSLNLSATGISIMNLPAYSLGSIVDLVFAISGTEYQCRGIVSRISRRGHHRAVGVAFQEASPGMHSRIHEVIQSAQNDQYPVTEPDVHFHPLDEDTVLALRSSNVQGDALNLMRSLITHGKVARADTAEKWLIAACDSFSPIEVTAINDPQSAPPWAQDAVLARLRAYRARARAGPNPPSDGDTREIFGLCQRLAESSVGADDSSLVKVTNIRAEVLRALYDPELFETT